MRSYEEILMDVDSNLQSVAQKRNVTIQPIQKPNSIIQTASRVNTAIDKTPVVGGVKKAATAGLGFVGNILGKPSEWVEQGITSGKGYEKTLEGMGVKNKYAQVGLSFAGRLALDPLNLLGVGVVKNALRGGLAATKLPRALSALKKSKAVVGTTGKLMKVAMENPLIYKTVRSTVKPYFGRKVVGEVIEGTKQIKTERMQKLYREISQSNKGLTAAKKARIGQLIEGAKPVAGDEELIQIAQKYIEMAKNVGKEAVDQKLLNKKAYEKMSQKGYLPHIWKKMGEEGKNPFSTTSPIPKVSGRKYAKFRKGAEGYVQEYDAPVFRGIGNEISDVEGMKMYMDIAGKTGVKVAKGGQVPQGYVKASKALQPLRNGKIVSQRLKNVYLPEDVVDILVRNANTSQKGDIAKVYDKAMNAWKAGKTIYNPAYHGRNVLSNTMLADAQTGRGTIRTAKDMIESARELKKGSKYVDEATDVGLIRKVNLNEGTKEFMGEFDKQSKLQKVINAPKKLQNASEETAKLAVFKHFRKQGMDAKGAMKKAEEAIFSPYRLSQQERSTLGRIFPFYSFTRQAAPFLGKQIVKHPERFSKYVKAERTTEKLTENEADNEKYLPDWMKGMVRTPFKNKQGQSEYLNTKYLYPWGNFMDDSNNLPLGLGVNPIVEEYASQASGKDLYFDKDFIREGMSKEQQRNARLDHATTTFAPAVYRSLAKKILPSVIGKEDYVGRKQDVGKVVGGELSGIKTYPFDVAGGKRSKESLRKRIESDYSTERYRIVNDRSKSFNEKKDLIKQLLKRKRERLLEL